MITAIIPARGGSKGIPRKNLVPICGKPLIVWSIEQALASDYVDEVIVTTDDADIRDVSLLAGASVFCRSPETATDTATSESAIVEVLKSLNYSPQYVVFLQATSPIRQPHDIDRAIEKLHGARADSLFSCRHIEGYTWTEDAGWLIPGYTTRAPRQIRQARKLEENGSIYVFRPSVLDADKRLGGKIAYYEMSPLDSFQLDGPDDVEVIETLMQMRMRAMAC